MDLIWRGIIGAVRLLWARDPEILRITALTIRVSGTATLLALLVGVPAGAYMGLYDFPGRKLIISAINAAMGLPPVVVGLWVSIFLWRNGPFGFLRLMFTPTAMIIAQFIIATPVVAGVTLAGIQQINPKLIMQLQSLGASAGQLMWLSLRESRLSLFAAVMAGFGAAVSEVGASMMVGGNILGYSRVLTTAISMEVSRGDFDIAMALSFVLLALSYLASFALTSIQQRRGFNERVPGGRKTLILR